MEDKKYRIVTEGELLPGFSHNDVMKNLAELCGYHQERLEKVFSGKKFVFKTNVDLPTAHRYTHALNQCGIRCQIEITRQTTLPDGRPSRRGEKPLSQENRPRIVCPNCGLQSPEETSCVSCGVVFSKYRHPRNDQRPVTAAAVKQHSRLRSLGTGLLVVGLLVVGVSMFIREEPLSHEEPPRFFNFNSTPAIDIETVYYPVSGETREEIGKSLQLNSPIQTDGVAHHGRTKWDVFWNYSWAIVDGQCQIVQVDTRLEVLYTLPQLTGQDNLTDEDKSYWRSYMRALTAHEEEHKRIAVMAAQEVQAELWNVPATDSCEMLEQNANTLGEDIVARYIEVQDQFDIDTNHGMDDGAVFRY